MLSIIIPTLNEQEELPKLLESLKNQNMQNFEVIVSDAQSEDKTREIAKEFGAEVVEGGAISFGRNAGAKAAKYDIFIFLDADTKVDNDFTAKVFDQFFNNNLDIASVYTYWNTDSLKSNLAYIIWDISKFLREKNKRPDGTGGCIVTRREVFNSINGFDEKLWMGEDTDFIVRAALAGFKYGMLRLRIHQSPRRYKKVGLLRVWAGNLLAGIKSDAKSQERAVKIYGGWKKKK